MTLTAAEAVDLIQKLGFPVVIAMVFAYFGWRILNRFLGHMERTVEKQDRVNEKFTETLGEISRTMQKVADTQDRNLNAFTAAVPQMTCRNYVPK